MGVDFGRFGEGGISFGGGGVVPRYILGRLVGVNGSIFLVSRKGGHFSWFRGGGRGWVDIYFRWMGVGGYFLWVGGGDLLFYITHYSN